MNARHIEGRRETFMGQELVYYVTVFEPLPEPSQENPYCDGGRCMAETPAPRPTCDVASEPEKRVPSKAEYFRSFAKAGALPLCVYWTKSRNFALLKKVTDWFGIDPDVMPRRLRKAIARIDLSDLAGHYDSGAFGRVSHFLYEHQGRVFAAQHSLVPLS
jgi:hypothetical protein